ncbi:MAG: ArsR/SmtB family transcription factor [Acidimicrobiales bacterium]
MTLDQTFAALADPTRIEIVARLSKGSASVGELAEPFAMSLRGVLKHVQVLEEAGVVRTAKEGRVRRCELEATQIDAVEAWAAQLRRRWERRLDRLERFAREREHEGEK